MNEWVAHVSGYLVWEEFETGRLWWLQNSIRDEIYFLDVKIQLGTVSFGDARRFSAVIWQKNGILGYPRNQARYSSTQDNHYPERMDPLGTSCI